MSRFAFLGTTNGRKVVLSASWVVASSPSYAEASTTPPSIQLQLHDPTYNNFHTFYALRFYLQYLLR